MAQKKVARYVIGIVIMLVMRGSSVQVAGWNWEIRPIGKIVVNTFNGERS